MFACFSSSGWISHLWLKAYVCCTLRMGGYKGVNYRQSCQTIGGVLQVRRSRRQRQDRVLTIHAHRVRDDEPLIVLVQRTNEREPELRRIEVVVHAFAQHVVRLPSAARITEHAQARSI